MGAPRIDTNSATDILKKIEELVPTYLPEWTPSEGDGGWAIAQIFSKMLEGVGSELNRVPNKLFVSYLDALGFTQAPPLCATAPVTFTLTKNFNGTLTVPAKTELSTKEKVAYETDNDFSATSANLTALYGADAVNNLVGDFTQKLSWEESVELFSAAAQKQVLYLGDDDLFNIHRLFGDKNAYLEYIVPVADAMKWEYWGAFRKDEEPRWLPFAFAGNDLNKIGNSFTLKKSINGVETYWIRATLKPTTPAVSSYGVSYKSRCGIDALYCNDVSLDPSKWFYPFGHTPQKNETFYIASAEAFSKRGFTVGMAIDNVTVSVNSDGTARFGKGSASFEYYNGSSWKPLRIKTYASSDNWAKTLCDISFEIPFDMAKSTVNGDTNFWVRCKLLEADYGTYKCENDNLVADFDKPQITNMDIYVKEKKRTPAHVLRFAHQRFTDLLTPLDKEPYARIEESQRTLYLGFDAPFGEGLISMLLSVQKAQNLQQRQLQWYCYEEQGWQLLNVKDGSNGMVKSGLCSFIAPARQAASEQFGKELYWMKAVFSDDTQPVVLEGIYLNTVMATQCKTVEKELLGSSDGSASQRFTIKQAPTLYLTLWVLEKNAPQEGSFYEDEFGEGYWVEWSATDSLEEASGDERCYLFDAHSGEVTFGDDRGGMIPPIMKNGIMATYRTGGGSSGNAETGAITKMVNSIAYVDKVTNHEIATGGADEQSLDMLMKMAPKRMKHGYRAVTSDDYGALALEASSDVAKVKAISKRGAVDLLIVPYSSETKPMPSLGLIERVRGYIESRAPATADIAIVAPYYAGVGVDIEIVINDWNLAATLASSLQELLEVFLHPLEGGFDGKGWEFGQAPALSDFLLLLEGIEGVSYVKAIEITIDDIAGEWVYGMNSGVETGSIDRNSMICSVVHTINVKGE